LSYTLEIIADESWATHTARRFDDRVRPGIRVCLPAGDTVRSFYHEVARQTSLDGIEIFLLDEFGGLPSGDPARCEAMIEHDLLERAHGSPIVRWPDVDTDNPVREAERYRDLLADGGIDLAIVGLGGNGHVGMNEPGATPQAAARVVELAASTVAHAADYGATTAPTWGITVGLAELLGAGELWLLVTGEHKRVILARTLNDPISSDLPASLLRNHPNLTVFADVSAAATLRRR
jgi:glucosamine-6-phosphate deaminase